MFAFVCMQKTLFALPLHPLPHDKKEKKKKKRKKVVQRLTLFSGKSLLGRYNYVIQDRRKNSDFSEFEERWERGEKQFICIFFCE